MKKLIFLFFFTLVFSYVLFGQRPNVILFIADDMTWSDCEPYGNEDIRTPNIQRLADQGICLDNMFTATAMCSPTRQQLYTGLFPARSGAFPNHSQVYDGVKSLGHHFAELGYRVAIIGKKHYGPENSFPFDYLGGVHHHDGRRTDIQLEKIQPVLEGEAPFFLIVAQNQPHTPWNMGNPSTYHPSDLTIPEYMVDCERTRKEMTRYYAEITYADSLLGYCMDALELAGKEDETITIFTSEQGYSYPFGKWTCYDLGLKTAFIMSWPGKIRPGIRAQAMVQYVDVLPTLLALAGANEKSFDVGISDVYGSRNFDGRSFAAVIRKETDYHRDFVYGIHTTRGIFKGSQCYPVRSVRSSRYKYIQNLNFQASFFNVVTSNKKSVYYTWLGEPMDTARLNWLKYYKDRPFEELYDLENDPYEMRNLATDPDFDDVRRSLRGALEAWMIQQGDTGVGTEMKALERIGRK